MSAGQETSDQRALFIPLRTEYFRAFESGEKTVEYRRYGKRWNRDTCPVGRPVTLSKGYGTAERLSGVVTGFRCRYMTTRDWLACYGSGGWAACISIKVLREKQS